MRVCGFCYLFFSVASALGHGTSLQDFATANNLFTATLYKELLVNNTKNILVSPFSLQTVLALTHSGAKNATAEEIRSSLHLPPNREETELAVKNALSQVNTEGVALHTANKVYVKHNYPIKDEFKKIAKEVYQADLENIDFAKNVEAATKINQWVAEQTANKIQDLVSAASLDESSRIVLINALYFQSNWSSPFDPVYTRKSSFYTGQDVVEVDTINKYAEIYKYYECPDLQAKFLELPFQREGASMTIVLPKNKDGLSNLEKQMDAVLSNPAYVEELVEVSIPKFKIESSVDLKEVLKRLGVDSAFDSSRADFSGIAGEKGELTIGGVLQKTFIDVSENGVEAAAATVVDMFGAGVPVQPKKSFIVDRPFIFYIRVDGLILFQGRVIVPHK